MYIYCYNSIIIIDKSKDDDKAFIFTLKNPHGVEPTRFMKRKEFRYAIVCDPYHGPLFGGDILICIRDNLSLCSNENDGTLSYECHPEHKSSLFVNTAGPDEYNYFSVLDFEVYCIDNYKDYIYNVCKYPDIIWKYIETNDIPEESLKQFDDEDSLRNDLDAIHCYDGSIRLKISCYYLKNPSELLPNTQIVSQQYDSKLQKWTGDYKWKLIYRASEHDYTSESFHRHCDDRGPTLVVIKSSGGWIFGGYTTQSWSGIGI